LQEAVAAAEDHDVIVMRDHFMANGETEIVTNKTLTIDMNGFMWFLSRDTQSNPGSIYLSALTFASPEDTAPANIAINNGIFLDNSVLERNNPATVGVRANNVILNLNNISIGDPDKDYSAQPSPDISNNTFNNAMDVALFLEKGAEVSVSGNGLYVGYYISVIVASGESGKVHFGAGSNTFYRYKGSKNPLFSCHRETFAASANINSDCFNNGNDNFASYTANESAYEPFLRKREDSYGSFQDAFAAVSGGSKYDNVIEMTRDVYFSGGSGLDVTNIGSGGNPKNFILDLRGNTLYCNSGSAIGNSAVFLLNGGSDVLVRNGTIYADAQNAGFLGVFNVVGASTLTLENVNITAVASDPDKSHELLSAARVAEGTLNVSGSILRGNRLAINKVEAQATTVNITSGEFHGGTSAFGGDGLNLNINMPLGPENEPNYGVYPPNYRVAGVKSVYIVADPVIFIEDVGYFTELIAPVFNYTDGENPANHGRTVTLLREFTADMSMMINNPQNVTFDLNGHTITWTENSYSNKLTGDPWPSVLVQDNGSLTIKNGSLRNLFQRSDSIGGSGSTYVLGCYVNAKVLLEGVSTSSRDGQAGNRERLFYLERGCDLTVNGGDHYAADILCAGNIDTNTLTLKSGTFALSRAVPLDANILFYAAEPVNVIIGNGSIKSENKVGFPTSGQTGFEIIQYGADDDLYFTGEIANKPAFYKSLAAAVTAAAEGETVYQLGDVTQDGAVTIDTGRNFTLDLLGRTLTAPSGVNTMFAITNGHLTITNGTVNSQGEHVASVTGGSAAISIGSGYYSSQENVIYAGGAAKIYFSGESVIESLGNFRAITTILGAEVVIDGYIPNVNGWEDDRRLTITRVIFSTGGAYYFSLNDAARAVTEDGQVILLHNDLETTAVMQLESSNGYDIVLDLGGHTINMVSDSTGNNIALSIAAKQRKQDEAVLTVRGGTVNNSMPVSFRSDEIGYAIHIQSARVILDNVRVANSGVGLNAAANSYVTVRGGSSFAAYRAAGWSIGHSAIYVEDGSFTDIPHSQDLMGYYILSLNSPTSTTGAISGVNMHDYFLDGVKISEEEAFRASKGTVSIKSRIESEVGITPANPPGGGIVISRGSSLAEAGRYMSEGCTITLLGDNTLTEPLDLPSDMSYTLNLNGYTISGAFWEEYLLRAAGGGRTLIVKNGALEAAGNAALVLDGGYAELSGITAISEGSSPLILNNGAQALIDDCELTGDNHAIEFADAASSAEIVTGYFEARGGNTAFGDSARVSIDPNAAIFPDNWQSAGVVIVSENMHYNIEIAPVADDRATVSTGPSNNAMAGVRVTVYISDMERSYHLKSVTVNGGDGEEIPVFPLIGGREYEFVMPAQSVTVRVETQRDTDVTNAEVYGLPVWETNLHAVLEPEGSRPFSIEWRISPWENYKEDYEAGGYSEYEILGYEPVITLPDQYNGRKSGYYLYFLVNRLEGDDILLSLGEIKEHANTPNWQDEYGTPISSLTITGTPLQGETLTASVAPDDAAILGFMWYARDGEQEQLLTSITSGSAIQYTLTENEVGKEVFARAVTAVGPIAASSELPISAAGTEAASVTFSGTAKVGETLLASVSPYDAAAVSYQWYAAVGRTGTGIPITGATGSSYRLTAAEAGRYVYVVARGINGSEAVSERTGAVEADDNPGDNPGEDPGEDPGDNPGDNPGEDPGDNPGEDPGDNPGVEVASVTLSGTAKVGETLWAMVSPYNAEAVSYQWYAAISPIGTGMPIIGASAAAYSLTAAEAGRYIYVVARGINGSEAESERTGAVEAAGNYPGGGGPGGGYPGGGGSGGGYPGGGGSGGGNGGGDPDSGENGGITVNTPGEQEIPGGGTVDTPEGGTPVKNDDGSVTLPGGGTITRPDDTEVDAPGGAVIDEDGTIVLPPNGGGSIKTPNGGTIEVPPKTTITPEGEVIVPKGGAEVKINDDNGFTYYIPEGATIILDGNLRQGYLILVNNHFEDISEDSWYYDDVLFVYSHGLMRGTSASPVLFSPGIAATRGMIVTILYSLSGEPDVRNMTNPFLDVSDSQWYADAVKWAAQSGIVSGIGKELYAPDIAVTRQDLAVILNNYAEFAGIALPELRDYPGFADDADAANYAREAIERFVKAMILSGKGANTIDPKGEATRAEVAAMLHRFIAATEE
jgi:hypothetical protein